MKVLQWLLRRGRVGVYKLFKCAATYNGFPVDVQGTISRVQINYNCYAKDASHALDNTAFMWLRHLFGCRRIRPYGLLCPKVL